MIPWHAESDPHDVYFKQQVGSIKTWRKRVGGDVLRMCIWRAGLGRDG
jgi:hypothetical protein